MTTLSSPLPATMVTGRSLTLSPTQKKRVAVAETRVCGRPPFIRRVRRVAVARSSMQIIRHRRFSQSQTVSDFRATVPYGYADRKHRQVVRYRRTVRTRACPSPYYKRQFPPSSVDNAYGTTAVVVVEIYVSQNSYDTTATDVNLSLSHVFGFSTTRPELVG